MKQKIFLGMRINFQERRTSINILTQKSYTSQPVYLQNCTFCYKLTAITKKQHGCIPAEDLIFHVLSKRFLHVWYFHKNLILNIWKYVFCEEILYIQDETRA